jgi:hypothetical protein
MVLSLHTACPLLQLPSCWRQHISMHNLATAARPFHASVLLSAPGGAHSLHVGPTDLHLELLMSKGYGTLQHSARL